MGAKGKGIDTNILVFQSSEPEDTVHGGWNKNQWCWNITYCYKGTNRGAESNSPKIERMEVRFQDG